MVTPYTRMVFYHETDRMDVVNHGNYIPMCEEARVDFMDKIGLGYHRMEQAGIMLPVLNITCTIKNSLHFGEHISVTTKIEQYNGFRLSLSYEIRCVETGKLCAIATTDHCFTDTDIKPMRIQKKFPEIHQFFVDHFESK